ncbi:hypothetical protein M9H77_21524 [Catharanthus roseus]|uniref:Uncharacterized protein n=1 Tax=Catharanthus roseus TaxID=4058 RepID=A0ACC0ANA0_CATRO|nr:hypothetical protein M9H77_21524 [Catharanthus roseus]
MGIYKYIYLLSSFLRIFDLSTRSASKLKFVETQVNGRVSGLHCTWLVPCTRASSDDVDGLLTLRMDPLKEEHSTWRAWPNQYLRGHSIMLCGGTVA